MDYQETDYDYGDYGSQDPNNNSIKGLKIAIVILIVILIALGFQYFRQVQTLRGESADLIVEKDTLTTRLSRLMGDFSNMKFDNDTLNQNLMTERGKADSLMQKLTTERRWSQAKIREYERELGTLRSTMQGFVRQIDSLNKLNQKLTGENINMKREINTYKAQTAAAIETASELDNKIKRGQVIRARDINLRAINKRNKEVTRARQATQLVSTCVLTANELSNPGERTVYIRIIAPDGIDLQGSRSSVFDFEGQSTPFAASRQVDYQGEDLDVSVYYDDDGSGLSAGTYTVMVYLDGNMIGSAPVNLK